MRRGRIFLIQEEGKDPISLEEPELDRILFALETEAEHYRNWNAEISEFARKIRVKLAKLIE